MVFGVTVEHGISSKPLIETAIMSSNSNVSKPTSNSGEDLFKITVSMELLAYFILGGLFNLDII